MGVFGSLLTGPGRVASMALTDNHPGAPGTHCYEWSLTVQHPPPKHVTHSDTTTRGVSPCMGMSEVVELRAAMYG